MVADPDRIGAGVCEIHAPALDIEGQRVGDRQTLLFLRYRQLRRHAVDRADRRVVGLAQRADPEIPGGVGAAVILAVAGPAGLRIDEKGLLSTLRIVGEEPVVAGEDDPACLA